MDMDFATLTKHMGEAKVVVDIGGGGADELSSLHPRVTHIIDIFPPDEKRAAIARARGINFIIGDAAQRETWESIPEVDYAICSHTIEDTFDPVSLLREITKHSTRGYIEFPSIAQEVLPLNSPYGSAHHSWFVAAAPTAWALARSWSFSTRPRAVIEAEGTADRMLAFFPKIFAYADGIRGHRYRVPHPRQHLRRRFWRRPYLIADPAKRRTAVFWSGCIDGAVINCTDFADFRNTLQELVDATASHSKSSDLETQSIKSA
jgi:hypothetical protein